MSDTQTAAIQQLLDEAIRISGTPGISATIINGEETLYFSAGYANRALKTSASKHTLYELASVSKAFTAAGILLLEEHGLLVMTDPVSKYLPWFTLTYQGTPIDMADLTLNHFLHHTSGLTNGRHASLIPEGNGPEMLRKTVEALVGAELAFAPGEKYSYGTINYDILGLVIETVSNQSYESFMQKQLFEPLSLNHTYVYKEAAQATGHLAQGYRTSFMVTSAYQPPDYAGNKPAGYLITNAIDMARWMRIQLGVAQDIPSVFKTIIRRSHQGNMSVPDRDGLYYAAGWLVNAEGTLLEHTGGNPTFATKVILFPNEQMAISLLSNHANMNTDLVMNIKDILAGNLSQTYTRSDAQLLDIALSCITIISTLLAIVFCNWGVQVKRKLAARLTVTLSLNALFYLFFPMLLHNNWSNIFVWQTYSMLTAFISLTLLTISLTSFFCFRRHQHQR